VKEHTCQVVSKEKLAAYTDGDLSPSETERIAAHIATCPNCRAFAKALEQSLKVTQSIWQTTHAQWPETHSFDKVITQRWPHRKSLAVAASILLIFAIGTAWRLLSDSTDESNKFNEQAKIAELKLKIAEAGHAAQLLAAAELLSKYPESQSLAEERYRRIIDEYPDTAAATEAKLKIQ
jgi:hypothetical protein